MEEPKILRTHALQVIVDEVIIDPGFNFRSGGVDEKSDYFKGLCESIRELGLKEPFTVTPDKDGRMHLCDGEHRLRALRKLRIERAYAVVKEYESPVERFEESVIANLVKAKSRPYDIATACDRLRKYGRSRERICKTLGISPSYYHVLTGCLDRLIPAFIETFKRNDSQMTMRDLKKASEMEPDEQLKFFDDLKYGRVDGEDESGEGRPRTAGGNRPRMRSRDRVKAALADLRTASQMSTSRQVVEVTDDVRDACTMFARWIMGELEACPVPEPEIEKD